MTTKVYFIGGPLDLSSRVVESELPDPYYTPMGLELFSGNLVEETSATARIYPLAVYRRIFDLPYSRHTLYEYAGVKRD
jgi:hypothetical protein